MVEPIAKESILAERNDPNQSTKSEKMSLMEQMIFHHAEAFFLG
jgi:hypothetical protein